MDLSIDEEDEIEVTEEILSFHSNVRENIVSKRKSLLSLFVNLSGSKDTFHLFFLSFW
jgi:hypothetical protein